MPIKKYDKKIILLIGLVLSLAIIVITTSLNYYSFENVIKTDNVLEISLNEDTNEIEIHTLEYISFLYDVRYTLDGSIPTSDSDIYTAPISFNVDGRDGVSVRAAVFKGESSTEIYTKTIFSGLSVLSEDMYTVCITTEPDNLYSYETGILSFGAETQSEANDLEHIPLSPTGLERANFWGRGIEWERPATVEIYDSSGNILLLQDAGVRVSGGYSRVREIKSLRLYPRNSYQDGYGKFTLDILQQTQDYLYNVPITSFENLDLRNGGDDHAATMLNDAVIRNLANDFGFHPTATAVPVITYLNGEYYNIHWLHPAYDSDNIAAMTGLLNSENVVVMENAETSFFSIDFPHAYDEYQEAFEYLTYSDLNNEENIQALETLVDMENFLTYYAIEMFVNNADWPQNNYKIWRYENASEEEKQSNEYADGRWRYLIYDTDASFNTYVDNDDNFNRLINQDFSPTLNNVLASDYYKNQFINILCDMMATTFSSENLYDEYWEAKDLIEAEMAYREDNDPEEEFYGEYYRQIMYIKLENYINIRQEQVLVNAENLMSAVGRYTLNINNDTLNSEILVNKSIALLPNENISSTYFSNVPVEINCNLPSGTKFVAWEINGNTYTTQNMVIDETYVIDSKCNITLVTEKISSELEIYSIDFIGSQRYIEVINRGNTDILTKGYFITTSIDESFYNLPDITLKEGEILRIYAENSDFTPLGEYKANFDLKQYSIVNLYNSENLLTESVSLPKSVSNHILVKEDTTNNFVFKENE